ncbi:MAG: aromatic ring-hydroxylating dioxygenase subunit alpha [Actinomycetia bacterium]|nr:aromatic ring-hydroxylating dioxygenase subunit alpha [Actinomycetes bacterium]
MRNEAAQPIIRTLLDHVATGEPWRTTETTVPAYEYTDPDHLALEHEKVFKGQPQLIGLSVDIPEPGSYVTRDQFGLPLILSRGDDGQAHVLANVCAHRGAEVLTAQRGCERRFTCPYHAWAYAPDGTHVGLPDPTSFPSVAVPGPGMVELAVAEENGLIFTVPELGATMPDLQLGPMADDFDHLASLGTRHWRTYRFDLAMNWKLVVDTFLEGYHFAYLHKSTVGPIFVPNLGFAERFGPHLREVLARRTIGELADQDPETWDIVEHSALVYVLFPATVYVINIDHVETWRVHPHPTDPGLTVVDLDFYVPDGPITESSERHWELNWKLTIDTVRDEDLEAMAGAQRGLASGALEKLTFGANEPALALFHQSINDALSS